MLKALSESTSWSYLVEPPWPEDHERAAVAYWSCGKLKPSGVKRYRRRSTMFRSWAVRRFMLEQELALDRWPRLLAGVSYGVSESFDRLYHLRWNRVKLLLGLDMLELSPQIAMPKKATLIVRSVNQKACSPDTLELSRRVVGLVESWRLEQPYARWVDCHAALHMVQVQLEKLMEPDPEGGSLLPLEVDCVEA